MKPGAGSSEAFCLHSRPYRENSLIVQLFSRSEGKLSVVAKGVKTERKHRAGHGALLQPFHRLHIHWSGRGDLKTLTQVEPQGMMHLAGKHLFAGLYVNELLAILLPEHMEYDALYEQYGQVLEALGQAADIEPVLRVFEQRVLDAVGYGLSYCAVDHQGREAGSLQASKHYQYQPELGFIAVDPVRVSREVGEALFSGALLLGIERQQFDQVDVLQAAKRLMRMALGQVLGARELHSRRLFL